MARPGGERKRKEAGASAVPLASVAGGGASQPLELDRVVHERVRLALLSTLAVNDVLSFTELRDLLGTSDGNLSVHARRLEEAGYIACTKTFAGRTPRTEFSLTNEGRAALERYLGHMEAIIRMTRDHQP